MLAAEVAKVMAAESCVMFVGSGVSTASPSDLPSANAAANAFLRRVAEGIAAPALMDELLERRGVLPEFVYGLAERYFGERIYEVWKSLELWRDWPHTFSANAGHLAAVHVAARSATPVLTPNFDTFLEDAAGRLGLEPRVTVATPGERFQPVVASAGQVAIWKLHGTAPRPETVFSSVRTLTMPVKGLREHLRTAVSGSNRMILAGYSGRDLDIFPILAARDAWKQPIWVDPWFPSDHRAQLLNPSAAQVLAPFDDVGRSYSLYCDDNLRAAVETAGQVARSVYHVDAAAELREKIAGYFDRMATDLRNRDARRLILGELMINGGMAEDALSVLQGARCLDAMRSEQVRLMAKAQWELGNFRTSEGLARERLGARIPAAEADCLRFAVTAARMRAIVPPRALEGTRAPRPRQVAAIGVIAGIGFLRAAPRALFPSRVPEPTRTPLLENWIEHGIRLLATLHVFTTSASRMNTPRLREWMLARAWRVLRRQALRVGYAEGVGNAGRYLARLGIPDPNGVRAPHEFLGHFLGMGIGHRDAAVRAMERGQIVVARQQYMLGLEIARLQRDPVLLLTFVPLAKRLGIPLVVDRDTIARIEAGWASDHVKWSEMHKPRDGGQ